MDRQIAPNRLYFGDCLEIMADYVPDEAVDLIYLDPPFNSKRIYNAYIGGAQWVAFDDTWRWHEAIDDFHAVAGDVSLGATMEGLRRILGEGAELAYLSYMAHRLRDCRRVLKQSGSIYLHCDPTMSYLLRIIMNAIFETQNFRNEVIWCYRTGGATKRRYARKHDVILYYAKGKGTYFETPKEKSYLTGQLRHVKGRQLHTDEYGEYQHVVFSKTDIKLYRDSRGYFTLVNCRDYWNIDAVGRSSSERMGYPTQKPLALLDRIIRASCPPGGVVLDPFCGCGTTIHAAQDLDRNWIGIDVCVQACKVIQNRIEGHFDSLWEDIEFVGMPKTLDDAKVLAAYDPFKFERWAASLAPGLEANTKQRGDRGIDGRGRLPIRKGVFIDVVAQVKAGGANPGHVRAFNEARRQAGAELGVFTCFEDRVTRGMRDAAANAGLYMDRWPAIQIYTIEDYFANRLPDLPVADFPRP